MSDTNSSSPPSSSDNNTSSLPSGITPQYAHHFSRPAWSIDSWKQYPIRQQPDYKDKEALNSVLDSIKRLPPLVHPNEIDKLREELAAVARGEKFLLQGGDCAERFADCSEAPLEAKLKILLQMSLVITWGARVPTVRVGRVAGQYGKPRSSPIEKLSDGTQILSFKGDNVNAFEPNPSARIHDPHRLLLGHFHSAATINYIRALIKGGLADLHHSKNWDLGGVRDDWKRAKYADITRAITDALEFIDVCGLPTSSALKEVDFYTSHEGLILEYEHAVTKFIPKSTSINGGVRTPMDPPSSASTSTSSPPSSSSSSSSSSSPLSPSSPDTVYSNGSYYNVGAHFLWIGNRTRSLDGAHIEYFRGVQNPVGIKVDAEMKADELIALIRLLNPNDSPGKIVLITRFGCENIWQHLPPLIKALKQNNITVIWSCDPMHGNTYSTPDGIKTRNFDQILAELTATFQVHQLYASRLGGVHFELTGEDVTECVGGPQNLGEHSLKVRYTTYCDPRLNYLQSLEMSFLLADLLQRANGLHRIIKDEKKSDHVSS